MNQPKTIGDVLRAAKLARAEAEERARNAKRRAFERLPGESWPEWAERTAAERAKRCKRDAVESLLGGIALVIFVCGLLALAFAAGL